MAVAPSRPKTSSDRRLALTTLCAGFLMIILDTTIVNVALPSIQSDLRFSQSGLAWVVNAYLIPFAGLLLLTGRLGDLVGRTRVFVAGLVVFVAASVACGLAQSEAMLIAGRFVQGAGGALTSAVILGMIATLFPDAGERARAIAAYAFVGSAGASLGLVLGGVLTQAIDWHWIFFVNVPIGIATIVAARRVLPEEDRAPRPEGIDVPGAGLIVSALMLGVYAIVGTREHGWTSIRTLGLGGAALALLAAFGGWEARTERPLVPLRIFRAPRLAVANAVQLLLIAGIFGQQFLVALYLQLVLGFSAVEVGLGMAPIALAVGVASLGLAARAIERWGARTTLLASLALIAASLLALGRVPAHGDYVRDLLAPMIALGAGAGLAMPTLTTVLMASAGVADAGLASGLANTTQQIGAAIGTALLATLSTSRSDDLRAAGDSAAAALAGGYRLGFVVAAALVAAAFAVTLALLRE
jgi:EmrB/QacA subfamily drug resistance transporter